MRIFCPAMVASVPSLDTATRVGVARAVPEAAENFSGPRPVVRPPRSGVSERVARLRPLRERNDLVSTRPAPPDGGPEAPTWHGLDPVHTNRRRASVVS